MIRLISVSKLHEGLSYTTIISQNFINIFFSGTHNIATGTFSYGCQNMGFSWIIQFCKLALNLSFDLKPIICFVIMCKQSITEQKKYENSPVTMHISYMLEAKPLFLGGNGITQVEFW